MTAKIKKTFEGTYLKTVFIRDLETASMQFALEQADKNTFDLTIASIDKNNQRTEYVITANKHIFDTLIKTLQKVNTEPKRFA